MFTEVLFLREPLLRVPHPSLLSLAAVLLKGTVSKCWFTSKAGHRFRAGDPGASGWGLGVGMAAPVSCCRPTT